MKPTINTTLKLRTVMRSFVLYVGLLCLHASSFAQTQVARTIPEPLSPEGIIGFLEFKPSDYGTQKHPLIIFLHGIGERGNGTSQINSVAANGVPKYCAAGAPMRFTVGGVTSSFVVLSPQLSSGIGAWPTWYVKDMIAYAKANLQIDTNRIYVTGLSLGGGGVWQYAFESSQNAKAVAAIAPVCGTNYGDNPNACARAGGANLPIWAFHAKDDGTVGVGNTQNVQGYIWWCTPQYSPRPRFTYYISGGHGGAWINAYDTGHITRQVDSSLSGGSSTNIAYKATPNMYEWFLMQKRTPASVPVVDPGPSQTINTTSTVLNASNSYSPNGSISTYTWAQVTGPASATLVNANTAVPTVSNLVGGAYSFQVTVTDVLGVSNSAVTSVTVSAPLPVEWLYVKGQRSGHNNLVQWGTASESNSDYFSVERSEDGSQFTSIGKITAAGNSSLVKEYSFSDANIPAGDVAYYRLKQVDKDGKFKMSKVILINNNSKKTFEQIYPNPVHNNLIVTLDNASRGNGQIAVYDLSGRIMIQEKINKSQDLYNSGIDMKNLVPGLYIVEVKVSDKYKVMQRVVKQ
jgi:poly(3-hydroxybutyrate) depolymerase